MRATSARPDGEPDLLRFTTAGSVDDGKSTLIGRLLHDASALYEDHIEALRKTAGRDGSRLDFSLITDGLKAEREQGITIDVAYRYFATPRRRFIIADTPGHEQYTRNMATGASTASCAVVLIDARLGVLTQSKRHGFIASLLRVPHLVVAVNKMDLVDYDEDVFARIREEYGAFATRLGFADVAFIPVSAREGDNVVRQSARMPWYPGRPVLTHLENLYIAGDRNLIDFRFAVQRVVRPDHTFRGYSGQIGSGVVRPGDEVVVLASGRRSRVTRIVTYHGDLEYAFAPLSVTLCLADDVDISRGDMLAHPNNVPRTERTLDAMVIWMADEPLAVRRHYLVKHTSLVVKAACAQILYRVDPNTLHREPAEQLGLNEIGRARFTLFRSLHVDEYRRNRTTGSFILIDPLTNATVGAGMVTDRVSAAPPGAPREERAASRDITWQTGRVAASARAALLRQQAATIWLTGLSGSGKSTLAFEVERRLVELGHACVVLDGDNIRHGLNRDLGFAPTDRRENIRRVAEVARLFNDAGLIVVTAFISPYVEDREMARAIVGAERFLETHLTADLPTCEGRDPKGLYARARTGALADFTGVSALYEPPVRPTLALDTAGRSAEECAGEILDLLSERAILR
ncbi:MAG TPA: sulfate adenylyltransferase subunit CysN [Candidatus Binatia bacterium]|nr:sulfate adenylyltransferase subunit CysN [Candidatus Binatia bacterium]